VSDQSDRILVTGANGQLGRLLLCHLAAVAPQTRVRAAVRSDRAAEQLLQLPEETRPEIELVDYRDAFALARAIEGCSHVVHLVGILKQTRRNRYVDAHEKACTALATAAVGSDLRRIVSLSILGAHPDAANDCLASRGRADEILLGAKTPALILRLPMVLGMDDAATRALRHQASMGRVALVRGGATREQPIDAADVVRAVVAGLSRPGLGGLALDLAGPESLTHRELVERAAERLGSRVKVRSVPLFAARGVAWLAEHLLADPPITGAMLGVLEQDDVVDNDDACRLLEIELTPLDETLRRVLVPREEIA
jgi:NADH dehydrogenase